MKTNVEKKKERKRKNTIKQNEKGIYKVQKSIYETEEKNRATWFSLFESRPMPLVAFLFEKQ